MTIRRIYKFTGGRLWRSGSILPEPTDRRSTSRTYKEGSGDVLHPIAVSTLSWRRAFRIITWTAERRLPVFAIKNATRRQSECRPNSRSLMLRLESAGVSHARVSLYIALVLILVLCGDCMGVEHLWAALPSSSISQTHASIVDDTKFFKVQGKCPIVLYLYCLRIKHRQYYRPNGRHKGVPWTK